MTGRAGMHRRPFSEWVKLIAAGTALFFALLGAIAILDRLGIEPTRETGIALLCATAIPVAIGFSLYRRFRKR
jgi:4-amino-4-deoxy-L-arabinose transferase-like glycosyltransferase